MHPITTTPTAEDNLAELQRVAGEITDSGLTVTVNGARDAVLTSDNDEVGVYLGLNGRTSGENPLIPIAIQLPAVGSGAAEALLEQALRLSTEKVLARIESGWVEQDPTGQRTVFVGVASATDDLFKLQIQAMPAIEAVLGGKIESAIRFARFAPIAPTGGRVLVGGRRGRLTQLSASELHGLSVLLDETSESVGARNLGVDIRTLDLQTSLIRDTYNRQTKAGEFAHALTAASWSGSHDNSDACLYGREDEHGWLLKDARTLVLLDKSGWPIRVVRPFDLLVETIDVKEARGDAAATADWLLEQRQVALSTPRFFAKGSRPYVLQSEDSPTIVTKYVSAVKDARVEWDGAQPLAFAWSTAGNVSGVVSITAAGRLRHWDQKNGSQLLLAAAQPASTVDVDNDGIEVYRNSHNPVPSLIPTILDALATDGALLPLERVSSQPVLTSSGAIASTNGYSRAARTFLKIPKRDARAWEASYRVPDHPTRAEAQAAYDYLHLELFADFTLSSADDYARAMIHLLTAVGRNLIDGCPMFANRADNAGSGKTRLNRIIRMIAQGSKQTTKFSVGSREDEEFKKELVTAVSDGGTFMTDDEVQRGTKVKGKTLSLAITSDDGEFSGRRLGGNESQAISGIVFQISGNGFQLGSDFPRRTLVINFDLPGGIDPVTRTGFRHPQLEQWVMANRPALLAAAHTILRHGIQNPEPVTHTYGLNTSWAEVILNAAGHITVADGRTLADAAMKEWVTTIRDDDDLSEQWGPLIAYLYSLVGTLPRPVNQLRNLAIKPPQGFTRPDLPGALSMAESGSSTSATIAWGRAIAASAALIKYDGMHYQFKAGPKRNGKATWSVQAHFPDGVQHIPGRPMANNDTAREPLSEAFLAAYSGGSAL